jgi:colanic acid/amylovoran biosynthesis protein
MKTILVKAYTNVNFGDDMFLRILFERYSHTEFTMIAPKHYRQMFPQKNIRIITSCLPKEWEQCHIELSKHSDALLLIGGSIFMQMQRGIYNANDNYNRFLTQLFANKNKYIIGANFGPFFDTDFKGTYEQLFLQYTDICFREKYSYNLFSHLPQTRYRLDIAFQYKLPEVAIEKGSVGFSLIDLSHREGLKTYKDIYERMIVQMIEILARESRSSYLFAFCIYEGDTYAVECIIAKLSPLARSFVKIVYYTGDMNGFLHNYLKMESVFTTRFHAMVISMMANQNIYPLIYSDKMLHVLNDLHYKGSYSMIEELNKKEPKQMLADICNNRHRIVPKDMESAEKQFEYLDDFLRCEKFKKTPQKVCGILGCLFIFAVGMMLFQIKNHII